MSARRPAYAFRADGNAHIGMGHLSMCFALARALRDAYGAEAHFLVLETSRGSELLRWVEQAGIRIWSVSSEVPHREDFDLTRAALDAIGPDAVIMDLLTADPSDRDFFEDPRLELTDVPKYIEAVQRLGLPVLATCHESERVDWQPKLLLAMHPGQLDVSYPDDGARRLVGPEYHVLDPRFRIYEECLRATRGEARRILVSFGGSDPDGLTVRAAPALAGLDGVTVTALIGPGNPMNSGELRLLREAGVEIATGVVDVAPLLWDADVAVTAAGNTLCELAFLGTPGVVVSTRERQEGCARWFESRGTIQYLGPASDFDPAQLRAAVHALLDSESRRRAMSAAGRSLVDGRGAERVGSCLREVARP